MFNSFIIVFNNSDFIATIISSDDMSPREQLKNGISAIDLGNCTQKFIDYYNISNNKNILVMNIEFKNIESNEIESNSENSLISWKNKQVDIWFFRKKTWFINI